MRYDLFDCHCHLQLSQYDSDRESVLSRMREKRMGALIVGTDLTVSRTGVELARQHDALWASVGLHPSDNLDEMFDIDAYRELARDPKVVAIGECGLDYYHSGNTEAERAAQKWRFLQQVALAEEIKKPLIIHCREAHDDLLSIFRERLPSVPIVMHFFTASGDMTKKYNDFGCYLSFPGPVTYTDQYDESVRLCPPERLLIETDSPFAAPVPYRGKRNEPIYVAEVAQKVAAVREVSVEEVAALSTENALRLFGLGIQGHIG